MNAWTWRPTLALLEDGKVLDPDTTTMLGVNGHMPITAQEAARIADFLDTYLNGLPADGRVRLDGTVTTDPDTHQFHRADLDRNYSASTEWLRTFRDFCRAATEGFTCG
ncbi:hypothetical protein [Nonomuraea cavernae]|uniref:Uncharacterized protein n=1 Tax=Nonomuraea cavernae TaxID=2045107 RepID=A0A918DSG6_9ACTN|nr:hypothetical protein [Nonomuraea cavernae]MCA2189540.1 hypothetical protein [Nonomuraea cavernae]GGO81671.1 hypothetical protein GCM10012289_71180 [Nonomuraea cavernae]